MIKSFQKFLFVTVAFITPLVAGAQGPTGTFPSGGPTGTVPPATNSVGFQNPLDANTICDALKAFLNILMTFAVPVAVIFLVYAGFLFVWARGNPKGLEHAKRNLFFVVIGIALFMGAWLLGQVVANTLSALASGAGQPTNFIGECKQ